MTTTLSSVGGNSFVTSGTGPILQIKGITGDVDTTIVSTATTASYRLKTTNEMMRFSDDFTYHTNDTMQLFSNPDNVFSALDIWRPVIAYNEITGISAWPGGGGLGVMRFNNSLGTATGSWTLTALGSGFLIPISSTGPIISFETAIYIATPSTSYYSLEVGLTKNSPDSNDRLTFNVNPFNSSNLKIKSSSGTTGTAIAYPVSSMYDTWVVLKFVRRDDGTGVFDIYVNGNHFTTSQPLLTGIFYPVISLERYGITDNLNFFVDYVEVISNNRLR